MILTRCQFPPNSANGPLDSAGSQMKKSVLVWVPRHFYWMVATCFCFCYMAHSVDLRVCVCVWGKFQHYCNIFSVMRFVLLYIGGVCLRFKIQQDYISGLADCFVDSCDPASKTDFFKSLSHYFVGKKMRLSNRTIIVTVLRKYKFKKIQDTTL